MQTHPQAVRSEVHALSGSRQAAYRAGGVPGNPYLTREIAAHIEQTRQHAGVSRGAMLAALGMSAQAWRTWRSGKHHVRPLRAQRILVRMKIVQSLDLASIRETPPGQRTDRFLAAATVALNAARLP